MSEILVSGLDVKDKKTHLDTSAYLPATPWLQLMLVCCLFALWGVAGNLNDILIAQFKKGLDLTDTRQPWCNRFSSLATFSWHSRLRRSSNGILIRRQ